MGKIYFLDLLAALHSLVTQLLVYWGWSTGVGPRRTLDNQGSILKLALFFRLNRMFLAPKWAV